MDDLHDFEAALKGFVGVAYVPLLVATQVVAGINYCFVCNGKPATREPTEFAALIYIWKNVSGECHISEIKRLIS